MLTHLSIKNFAIISKLELDLASGMTVITGETGAGKSVILDTLDLVLGARANPSTVVKSGTEACYITVIFDLSAVPAAQLWLREHDFDCDNQECIIRRTITSDGKTKSYLNDQPCTLASVREFGSLLINIHGQHEYQNLLKPAQQRELLDAFGNNIKICAEVSQKYNKLITAEQELIRLLNNNKNAPDNLALLRHELTELETLALRDNEFNELQNKFKKYSNVKKIANSLTTILNLLSGNHETTNNVLQNLNTARNHLTDILTFDTTLQTTDNILSEATLQIESALDNINHYFTNLEIDPEQLTLIESKLDKIHTLSRKHKVTPEELTGITERLSTEIAQLENLEFHLNKQQEKVAALKKEYEYAATKLSAKRQQDAHKLANLTTKAMQQLNMQGGSFAVNITSETNPTAHGHDQIAFYVCTNKGQATLPLNQIASGGELSRLGLAIQTIIAKNATKQTLIFDEVDVGIGGKTAEIVGKLLRNLAQNTQVICITHLPQVAAQGNNHLAVTKKNLKNTTEITVRQLDKKQRINEIARMLGGEIITETTIEHATEMLERD